MTKTKNNKLKNTVDNVSVNKKGKNPGKVFEEDFVNSFPNMFIYRLRDSAGAWGGESNGKARFTPTNICDFIAHNHYKGETLLLELKSTQSKSMSFTNLKKHQVLGLKNALEHKGVKAYFIFNFRTLEETYAIEADRIFEFYNTSDRKSFPIDWVRDNGILIEQEIKISHYRYKVDKLLN